jgi:hypothetical protein
MKMYSISKYAFYGICLLILSLPVSRHWKLIVAGDTATGKVKKYEGHLMDRRIGEDEMEMASTIEFQTGGDTLTTRGPWNYEYQPGRFVKVRYDPEDPGENCLLTFTGFYLDNYSILPLFLLTVWGAFYLSYNSYRKKKRSARRSVPASSPYSPFGKSGGRRSSGSKAPGSFPRISPKDL